MQGGNKITLRKGAPGSVSGAAKMSSGYFCVSLKRENKNVF